MADYASGGGMNIDLEQTIELFSGEKPFSLIAQALGFKTFPVDRDAGTSPKLVGDIRDLEASRLPRGPHLIWAAPPISNLFYPQAWLDDEPATPEARDSMDLLRKTLTLMHGSEGMWWFLETPTGLPRQMPLMSGFNRGHPSRVRHTIRHGAYGGDETQCSDVWTNAYWWTPRPENAEFSIASSRRPPRVPAPVFAEIFDQLEQYRIECSRADAR